MLAADTSLPEAPVAAGALTPGGSGALSVSTKKKLKFQRQSTTGEAPEMTGIKWPELKGPTTALRSQRMKLPASVGQKKSKAIEQLLEQLGVELNPMACDEVNEQLNQLRADILLLYDLRTAFNTCQYELETMRQQYVNTTGKDLDLPPELRDALGVEGPENADAAGPSPSPSPSVQLSPLKQKLNEIMEGMGTATRKRKLVVEQNPVVRKLRKSSVL